MARSDETAVSKASFEAAAEEVCVQPRHKSVGERAEHDGGTHKPDRSSSRGRSAKAVQKPEEEAPAKQSKSRSKKARRPLVRPCSLPMVRCMVMRAWCMHGVAGGLRARCLDRMIVLSRSVRRLKARQPPRSLP